METRQEMQAFYHHTRPKPNQPWICCETGKPFEHCRIETDSNGAAIRSCCEHCEAPDFPLEPK
jgi:hypothetical protein